MDLSSNPVIQIIDLTKRYGDFLAVDHLNFQIREGEIFSFLGPNGSRKTTTIRMLVGLSKPTEGRASILGYNILSNITEAKRYIGVVPDISNLYDELSARNNLLFMTRGLPGAWEHAVAALRNSVELGIMQGMATLMSRETLDAITDILDLAEEIGIIKVIFFNFIPVGRAKEIAKSDLTPKESGRSS